jgi:hypothetical protein
MHTYWFSEDEFDLITTLKCYVAFQIEKLKLFDKMGQAQQAQWPDVKKQAAKFFDFDRQLKKFSQEIIARPEIIQILNQKRTRRFPVSIVICNDFRSSQKIIEKETLSQKEIFLILEQIQRQAHKYKNIENKKLHNKKSA